MYSFAPASKEEATALTAAYRKGVAVVPFFQLELGARIDKGGYGDVWTAEFRSQAVAVKMTSKSDPSMTSTQQAEQDRKV